MDATKPFDASTAADVILRSSDSVDFSVIKLLLCLISPVFNVMFLSKHIATADAETRKGLPVVSVTEDSETLRCLLLLIYPSYVSDSESALDINVLYRVAKAAQKYCMDRIEGEMMKMVTTSRLLQEHAFRVYASAAAVGWTDVAAAAALSTLKTPLSDLPFVDELKIISGADFYHFLTYRFKHDKYGGEGEEPQLIFASQSPTANGRPLTIVTNASPSFGRTEKADAILRSLDGTDFYIKRSFLTHLSPVFEELFADDDGVLCETIEQGNDPPVFTVDQDSDALAGLLCFLHPCVDEPHIEDIKLYPKIWAAAEHYKVTFLAQRLERLFLASPFIQAEPWRAFAVGVMCGWTSAMKASAMKTLEEPLNEMKYVEEFRSITGADLHHLVKYRFKCANVVCTLGDKAIVDSPVNFKKYIIPMKPRLLECPRGITLMRDDRDLVKAARLKEKVGSSFASDESKVCDFLKHRKILAADIDAKVCEVCHVKLFRLCNANCFSQVDLSDYL